MVRAHGPMVWRIAKAVVHDAASADDVTQDVMVKAWRAIDDFEDGVVPVPWLRRVAKNTAISALRSRSRLQFTDSFDSEVSRGPSTEYVAEQRAFTEVVDRAMASLDPDSRAMLVMQHSDGASYDDIAEAFDISSSAVKAKLYRARHTLKVAVGGWAR